MRPRRSAAAQAEGSRRRQAAASQFSRPRRAASIDVRYTEWGATDSDSQSGGMSQSGSEESGPRQFATRGGGGGNGGQKVLSPARRFTALSDVLDVETMSEDAAATSAI
jgi:hypothetical protein